MSPFDLRGFSIGRGTAFLSAAVLAACAVYDDSLLQSRSLGGGNVTLVGSGGASGTSAPIAEDSAKAGGYIGSPSSDLFDAAVGAGGGGSGGAPGGTGGAAQTTSGADATLGVDGGTSGSSAPSDSGSDARALTEELIDDMEDGNGFIPAVDGRRGTWSVGSDGTVGSEQVPTNPFFMTLIPNGRDKSSYAAHTAGHGFTGWGAVMLVALNQLSNDPKQPYDASDCVGLTFWAKVGPAAATSYKIRIANADTLPEGKVCSGMTCNDHHEILATWSTTWTKYTYLFADMRQEGWGVPQKPFDTTRIYDIEFQTSDLEPFDFWIDDLAFVK